MSNYKRKRGVHYVYTRKGRSQEESLEHLERWEPFESGVLCKTCGLPCTERLNEVSIMTTYRCASGHKYYKLW